MRVQIDLRVTFETPFTVGTGAMAGAIADKPTYRDALGRPVVPASNLKGKVRHACERILRTLTEDDAAACHSPRAETMCPQDPVRLGQDYCPICQIFGGPSRPAALHFSDLQWEQAGQWESIKPPTLVRTNVSIRRARRVAEPDRLFTTETFAPSAETVFEGKITGHLTDIDQERYSLVALLIAGLRQTMALGGGRSRGLGRCRIEPIPVEILDDLIIPISDRRLKEALLTWTK